MIKPIFLAFTVLISHHSFANTGCYNLQLNEIPCPSLEKSEYQKDFELKLRGLDTSNKQKYLSGYMQILADNYTAHNTQVVKDNIPNEIGDIKLDKNGKPSFFSKSKLNNFLKNNSDIDLVYKQYLARMKGYSNNHPISELEMSKSDTFKDAIADELSFPFYKLYVHSRGVHPDSVLYLSLKLKDSDYKHLLNWINHGYETSPLQLGTALALHSFNTKSFNQ